MYFDVWQRGISKMLSLEQKGFKLYDDVIIDKVC